MGGEKAGKKLSLLFKPPPQPQQAILEHYSFFFTLRINEKERNFVSIPPIWIEV